MVESTRANLLEVGDQGDKDGKIRRLTRLAFTSVMGGKARPLSRHGMRFNFEEHVLNLSKSHITIKSKNRTIKAWRSKRREALAFDFCIFCIECFA